MNWVEADLSKPLLGHFQAGAFDVGDIVEISRSLGSPHDLHIVSLFLQNVLTITLIFYRSRWSKEDRFRYHLVTWRQISFPLSETTSLMVKKIRCFCHIEQLSIKDLQYCQYSCLQAGARRWGPGGPPTSPWTSSVPSSTRLPVLQVSDRLWRDPSTRRFRCVIL